MFMTGAMVLVMIGTMVLFRVTGYVHWYLFLRREERFRKILCLYEKDLAFQMDTLNVRSRDVVEKAQSLLYCTDEDEEKPMLETLREVARNICDEKRNELQKSMYEKYRVYPK